MDNATKLKKIKEYGDFFALRIMEDMQGFNDFNSKLLNYIYKNFGKEFEYSDKINLTNFELLKLTAKNHKISDLEIEISGKFKFINDLCTRFLFNGNGKGKIVYKKFLKKEEKNFEFSFNIDTNSLNYEIEAKDLQLVNIEKTLIFNLILYSILRWYQEIAKLLIKNDSK